MSIIRTVLGDIAPARLGVCYSHEHIIIDPSFTTQLHPEFLLDSVDLASEELLRFHAAGGRAMVDSMPCGGGRNVVKLAAISQRTNVHILCPTGLHLSKYYAPDHWCNHLPASELANLFIADIEQGIDANDYNGVSPARTDHRAGLIKIASSLDRLTDHEKKIFEAAAITHRSTGAPILTHTEQGTAAIEQIKTLQSSGVDLFHVVLSHTDRRPDIAYHKEILSTGVFVEFDSAFRGPPNTPNKTMQLIIELFELGLSSQILLGMDAARRSYWKSYGGSPGLTFLLETFSPNMIASGISPAAIHAIFTVNPARAYAFTTPT